MSTFAHMRVHACAYVCVCEHEACTLGVVCMNGGVINLLALSSD